MGAEQSDQERAGYQERAFGKGIAEAFGRATAEAFGRAAPEAFGRAAQKPLEEPPQKPLEEPPEKPLVEPPQKPLVEPPQKPLVEPPQKPLVEPPQKTLEEPAAKPLVELRVPIKKEPIDHPIKMEPGVKQEAKAKDEVRCPGFAAAVESEGGPDVPGVESPGPDAAQGNDNGDGRRGTDERDDGREMPRPALLSTAGVVSPGDQKPAGKKSKKKKGGR